MAVLKFLALLCEGFFYVGLGYTYLVSAPIPSYVYQTRSRRELYNIFRSHPARSWEPPLVAYPPSDHTFSGLLIIGWGLSFLCTVPHVALFLYLAGISRLLVTGLGMIILILRPRKRRTAPLNLPFLALMLVLQIGLAFMKGETESYQNQEEVAGLVEGTLWFLRPQPFWNLPWPVLVHTIALLTVGTYVALRLTDEPQLIYASVPLTEKAIDESAADKGHHDEREQVRLVGNNGPTQCDHILPGLMMTGFGFLYLLSSFMPVERNIWLYASVPVQLMLAGLAVGVCMKKGKLAEGTRKILVGFALYEAVHSMLLGLWLWKSTGMVTIYSSRFSQEAI